MKVIKYSRKFAAPSDAEEHYFGTPEVPMSTEPLSHDAFTQTEVLMESIGIQTEESMEVQIDGCNQLAPIEQLSLREITSLFQKLARTYQVCIEDDFLQLVLQSCQHLQKYGRSNVLDGLARAIGRLRPDGSDSRLPVKRMPMGLIEYNIVNFFNAESYQKVYITLCMHKMCNFICTTDRALST